MKTLIGFLLLVQTLASVGFSQVVFNQSVGKRSNASGHFDRDGSLHVVIQGDSLGRNGSNEKRWQYLCVSNNSVIINERFDAPSETRIARVLSTTPEEIHVLAYDTKSAQGFSPLHILRTGGRWKNLGHVPIQAKEISPLHSATAIVSDGTVYYFYLDLREAGRKIIYCSAWQPLKGWSKLPPLDVREEVRSLSCAGDFRSQRPALGWITKSNDCLFVSEFDVGESKQKMQTIQIAANTALALYKAGVDCYALTISDVLRTNWERQQSTLTLYHANAASQVQGGLTLTNHFPSKIDPPSLDIAATNLTLVWSSFAAGQHQFELPRDVLYSAQRAGQWTEPRTLNFKSVAHAGIKILGSSRENGRTRVGLFSLPSGFLKSASYDSRVEIVEIAD